MSLTDQSGQEDLRLLRARYVALLRALRLSAAHNPETVEALERIFPGQAPESAKPKASLPPAQPLDAVPPAKHHAA